jgi:hypothetical protein
MTLKQKISSTNRLTRYIAAGVTAAALAVGGFAIADASSGNNAPNNVVASTGTGVIPFQRGQPSPATPVGQVPSDFSAGAGTIVTGAAADSATAAALAAYPGGTVNRVVQLSGGDFNVHMIGVNWPHHVFVNQAFQVIGAE